MADYGENRIAKGTPAAQLAPLEFAADSLTVSNGVFRIRLTARAGSDVVVEASANLQTWTPIQTNAVPPEILDVSVPVGTNQSRFLRARLAP